MSENNPTNQARAAKQAKIQELLDHSHSMLVTENEKASIPEDIFKDHFLPFFSGEGTPNSRNVIGEWIGIAGTPMSEVSVINPKGEVLFDVPALFNTDILNIANQNNSRISLNDIVRQYEQQKLVSPIAAVDFLENSMAAKQGDLLSNQSPTQTTAARWTAIMERYGKIKPVVKGPDAPAGDEDDVVYD